LAVPSRLVDAVAEEKHLADRVGALIDQRAFAQFLAGGELDRHLRRMRVHYRARRDALVQALADELPEATVEGIAAGLHATVRLPEGDDERAIVAEAERRRIALEPMDDYREGGATGPPTLLIGYGQIAEPSIRPGIRALAEVIQLVRSQSA
jgi:GntR family transcriptional regulator/MocR family aminotransferase